VGVSNPCALTAKNSNEWQDKQMSQSELDLTVVGERLLALVLASVQAGHKHPRSTLVYVHPSDREGQFVHDMMSGKSTEDLCNKWLGGRDGALDLILASERRET
jgi:hypothetical protein